VGHGDRHHRGGTRLESLLLERGFRGGADAGTLLPDAPIETSGA
jgi:hypothetical protein